MKKVKRKPPTAKKRKTQTTDAPAKPARRSFLSSYGAIAAGVVVLGAVGLWGGSTVRAAMAERDLTRLGQGLPAIVQVHDVQCPTCVALQREVRAALETVDSDTLDYLVADLKSDEGLAFAGRFGAGHSTLLFFDAGGALTGRLVGPNGRDRLAVAFQRHAAGGN